MTPTREMAEKLFHETAEDIYGSYCEDGKTCTSCDLAINRIESALIETRNAALEEAAKIFNSDRPDLDISHYGAAAAIRALKSTHGDGKV